MRVLLGGWAWMNLDHSRIRHFFKAGWSIAMAVHTGESI